MTVRRVMGIETEYGVLQPGRPQANPMLLSSQVVTTYRALAARADGARGKARWDYDDEDPLQDARGLPPPAFGGPSLAPDGRPDPAGAVGPGGPRHGGHGTRRVLPGGRPAHARGLRRPERRERHPDQRRAPVRRPRAPRVLLARGDQPDRRGALGRRGRAHHARGLARAGRRPGLRRSRSTRTTSTARARPTARTRTTSWTGPCRSPTLVELLTPFLVTRQVFTGSGRVGLGSVGQEPGFQLSQRADYMEAEVGLETTLRRPIVNTRDEPHADRAALASPAPDHR